MRKVLVFDIDGTLAESKQPLGEPMAQVAVPRGGLRVHEGVLLLGLEGGAVPLHEVTPMGGRRMSGAALIHGRPELLAPHARIRS